MLICIFPLDQSSINLLNPSKLQEFVKLLVLCKLCKKTLSKGTTSRRYCMKLQNILLLVQDVLCCLFDFFDDVDQLIQQQISAKNDNTLFQICPTAQLLVICYHSDCGKNEIGWPISENHFMWWLNTAQKMGESSHTVRGLKNRKKWTFCFKES